MSQAVVSLICIHTYVHHAAQFRVVSTLTLRHDLLISSNRYYPGLVITSSPLFSMLVFLECNPDVKYPNIFACWINPCLSLRRVHVQYSSLQWRPNGCDSVSSHQPHDCLLNRLFRHRSKITSKLRVTGLCGGNSPVTGEFPAQMASNAENDSFWWRHHVIFEFNTVYCHQTRQWYKCSVHSNRCEQLWKNIKRKYNLSISRNDDK